MNEDKPQPKKRKVAPSPKKSPPKQAPAPKKSPAKKAPAPKTSPDKVVPEKVEPAPSPSPAKPSGRSDPVDAEETNLLLQTVLIAATEQAQNNATAAAAAAALASGDKPKSRVTKSPWTPEEDAVILAHVAEHGAKGWAALAKSLTDRKGKQCRERFYNQLDTTINTGAWTEEEEGVLIQAHAEHGNAWAKIAKLLPGRTDNSTKNHWNASIQRRMKLGELQSIPGPPVITGPPVIVVGTVTTADVGTAGLIKMVETLN